MTRLHTLRALAVLCTLAVMSGAAFALDPYDAPVINCESATLASITLHVCGGATTGAPAGVTIQWKTAADYAVSGWSDENLCKLSLSGQPSMQHPDQSRWELLPGECEDIIIGDINFDETGVSGQGCGVAPLECGTEYVIRAFAHAGRGFGRSDWMPNITCSTAPCPSARCTYTQGYWKNHGGPAGCDGSPVNAPDPVWPAAILSGGMDLGNVHYSPAQLCFILNAPAAGKGLVALAHQLIAAQLNLANGATDCTGLEAAIVSAHGSIGNVNLITLINGSCSGSPSTRPPGCGGAPAVTGDLTGYNEGTELLCAPNCHGSEAPSRDTSSVEAAPWGNVKELYR